MAYMDVSPAGHIILSGVWIPTAMSGLFVVLRIYCKHTRERRLWWDDVAVIASWVLLLGANIATSVEVWLGLGLHLSEIPQENQLIIGPVNLVIATMSISAAAWSKIAFGITLYRITTSWARYCVVGVCVTIGMASLAAVTINLAQCSPPQKLWKPETPGTCLPPLVRTQVNMYTGVYVGVMDLFLAFLPWTILPKLKMRMKEKIGVGCAMSLGVLAGIAAFVKSAAIPEMVAGDYTFIGKNLFTWATVEISVAIIAATIPILRALLSEYHRSRYEKYGASLKIPDAAPRSEVVNMSQVSTRRDTVEIADQEAKALEAGFSGGIVKTSTFAVEIIPRDSGWDRELKHLTA